MLVSNGIALRINSKKVPTGYSAPASTPIIDAEYSSDLIVPILKSVVELGTGALTMDAIFADLETAIGVELGGAYDDTLNTVTWFAVLEALTINYADLDGDGVWLLNTDPATYLCTLKIHVDVVLI